MRHLTPRALGLALALLLPLALFVALVVGPQLIHPFTEGGIAGTDRAILLQIRLPRALLAALVGGTLAVSGVMMQGLFRNPLADPSLIGVSAGASAGASLVIVLAAGFLGGPELLGISLVAIGAFLGAVLTTSLVYRLSVGVTGASVATMLLAGIAISALAGAINSFLSYVADNHMLRQISLWQMGSLGGASWGRVAFAVVVLLPLATLFSRFSGSLNVLLLGESEARHLGVDVARLKRQLITLVALAVGVAVALSGTIAFVGLVVPHIVRLLIGPDHRFLIPCATLAGAALLVLADALARWVLAPAELPIGVVTAALGAPFFLSLLRRRAGVSG